MDEAKHYKFLKYKYEVEAAARAKSRLEHFTASRVYSESGFKDRDEKTVADFVAKYGKL